VTTMTRRLVFGALFHRKGTVAVAVAAVALGTSLVVAAVNLRRGVMGRFGEELRAHGPNLMLVPRTGAGPFLDEKELDRLGAHGVAERLKGHVPFVFGVAKIQGRDLVLGGTNFRALEKVSPWWQVEGRWPHGSGEALVGLNVAVKLGLGPGDSFSATHLSAGQAGKSQRRDFFVSGIVRTGGPEEHQVFVDLKSAQSLLGLTGLVTMVLASSATATDLEQTVAIVREAWPGAEVKTQLQVAEAEKAVLSRVEGFLSLVAAVVLFVSGVSVFSTMAKEALERRVEMALMRALGASVREVAWIFTAEAASIGVLGGLVGFVMGILFAQLLGLTVFGAFIHPSPESFVVGIAVGVSISLVSSLSVVRRITAAAPALVLKGE
jgi:putative ABC transport system permease protein